MDDENMIRVWAFNDAPQEFQDMSPHGGDEDWVALLPVSYKNNAPLWMDSGLSAFGRCSTSEHELPDGRTVCIGAHA